MKTFNDLEWKARPVDPKDYDTWVKAYPAVPDYGMYARAFFDNGWGIEVARGPQTMGGDQGLFEANILDSNGDYCYTTIVANGPVGSLSESDVTDLMLKIELLK